jgi:hypothetical protein
LIPVVVESPTSPYDDDRVGVSGERGHAYEGDCGENGGIPGDGGAMRPSAPRDDDRPRPGTEPSIRRKREARGRGGGGGKDAMDGELLAMSSGPGGVSTKALKKSAGEEERNPDHGDSPDVGSVLSLALRLKKRKSGVSQTQIAKNVAISPNAGGRTTGPPR